jgi:UDP-GlcNAc:undecaprenyl-phosphate GlcNAc-1-phosphate transferase
MRVPVSLLLALSATGIVLATTPLAIRLASALGAIARPGARHVHQEPVPRLGGLAIALAVLATLWIAFVLPGPARMLDHRPLLGLTLASVPILLLGIIDDIRGVSAFAKLGVQLCSALLLVSFGYGVPLITHPFGGAIATSWLDLPLTVLWVVTVTNAINLIDGLDGLASGVVLIAAMTLWWVGRMHSDFYVMFIAAPLAGATLGLLRWNFPRARVFMGDTGSQFLGLALAAASLLENRKGTATVTLLFPLVAMGLPIADSLLAFARRLFRGEHVFRADSQHIHHRLLHLGLSPRGAVLTLWALSAGLGLIAIVLAGQPRRFGWTVLVVLAVALFGAFEWLEALDRRPRRGDDSRA